MCSPTPSRVVSKTPDDLVVRLAALFHDIGKPRTRSYEHGEVTFRHHEAVGARMTRKRLAALAFDERTVEDVSELVRLSGRFKGYSVRLERHRGAPLRPGRRTAAGRLNQLVRSDCTTRNLQKEADLHRQIDDLERRIAELAEAERKAAERPQIDGAAVMAHLGLDPGPRRRARPRLAAGTQALRGGTSHRRIAGSAGRLVGREPLLVSRSCSLRSRAARATASLSALHDPGELWRTRSASGPVASTGTRTQQAPIPPRR